MDADDAKEDCVDGITFHLRAPIFGLLLVPKVQWICVQQLYGDFPSQKFVFRNNYLF